MRGVRSAIPDGDTGTMATLQVMRTLARQGALDPVVRLAASAVVRGLAPASGVEQAQAVRAWVTDHTAFLADPLYAEALHMPGWQVRQILTRGLVAVDCDDVAMLAAALGLSIGLRARFVVVGFSSPNAPFRHVWCDLAPVTRDVWVAIDPTRPQQALDRVPVTRHAVMEV